MSDVLAIDQGTTSTRAMVFDAQGMPVATGQLEHRQFLPQPGCLEHHAVEMWRNTREVIGAALGHTAFDKGESKNTYGTGNFLIVTTGEELVASSHGLISTVAYQLAGERPRYALEGSIAVTG